MAAPRAPQTAGSGGDVQVYTVRIWSRRGAFRAAVRPAGGDAPVIVDSPAGLAEFFAQAARITGPVTPGPRPADAP